MSKQNWTSSLITGKGTAERFFRKQSRHAPKEVEEGWAKKKKNVEKKSQCLPPPVRALSCCTLQRRVVAHTFHLDRRGDCRQNGTNPPNRAFEQTGETAVVLVLPLSRATTLGEPSKEIRNPVKPVRHIAAESRVMCAASACPVITKNKRLVT